LLNCGIQYGWYYDGFFGIKPHGKLRNIYILKRNTSGDIGEHCCD
jgi:hypothetical protein